jgi:hypothetical protein
MGIKTELSKARLREINGADTPNTHRHAVQHELKTGTLRIQTITMYIAESTPNVFNLMRSLVTARGRIQKFPDWPSGVRTANSKVL